MEKKLSALLAVSTLALGMSACCMYDHKASAGREGKYEKSEKSTDARGTTTERESSTEVDLDSYGNRKTVVKTKTSRDPKGLMNKTTTKSSKQAVEENQ